MRLIGLLLFVFILAAFAIGSEIERDDIAIVDEALDRVIVSINNISLGDVNLTETSIPNMDGFFNVLEHYVRFVGSAAIEILRAGIYFGSDNPTYFNPETIVYFIKAIIWLVIISLLIKPVSYLVVFIIVGLMYLFDRRKKKKIKQEEKEDE